MEAENLKNDVEITIFDKEPSWKGACDRVLQCVAPGLKIALKFVVFDATDKASFFKLSFSDYHLVTANFFASEIRKAKIINASRAFWQHMFSSMGAGKVFVAVDFADADGSGWSYINGVLPAGATTILSDSSLGMSCPDSKQSIQLLENEIDHRPKKNAQNFVLAAIT